MIICGFGLSGGVASDDPILNKSCWMVFVSAAISASSQIDRAKPIVEFSSSMVPYVSTRIDAFDTRTPPARLVSPLITSHGADASHTIVLSLENWSVRRHNDSELLLGHD